MFELVFSITTLESDRKCVASLQTATVQWQNSKYWETLGEHNGEVESIFPEVLPQINQK